MRRTYVAVGIAVALCLALAPQAAAQTAVINGNPLRITIANDTSFQVVNSAISTTIGQIYPGPCITGTADAGVMAAIGPNLLFTPSYEQHGCGTAAYSLGVLNGPVRKAWTPVSINGPSGQGTAVNPYVVTVVVDAAGTGVRLTARYSYVNNDPFFRISKTFTATTATSANVYFGGDIYLASSDAGVPYYDTTLQSPGGKVCQGTPYTILLIPITPASHYVAQFYNTVWSQIATRGNLSDTVGPTCTDNGAALQWSRTLAAGSTTTIESVVSFGAIPRFEVLSVTPPQGTQGQTLTVVVSGLGFQNGTTFNFGPGITVTSTTINSSTQATLTIVIDGNAPIGPHDVIGTQSPGGLTDTLDDGFTVLPRPCVRTIINQARCQTGPNGLPTGNYTWTFRFQNQSGAPISHMFVSGLPTSASVLPDDHVVFNPAVTNVSPLVTLTFQNVPSGPLTFTVSFHDASMNECCSTRITVEIPSCECAQNATEIRPQCFTFFPFSSQPPYKYTFSLQNFSSITVENLVVVPVDPSDQLTPIPPSQLTVTDDLITIPPIQPGQTTPPQTVTLTGPLAVGGTNVCLSLSMHARDLYSCCSIVRCFTIPRCDFDLDDFERVGGATVTELGGRFVIEGIGSSGEDGVDLDLDGARTAALEWEPLDAAGPLPNGAFIELGASGDEGSGRVRVTRRDNRLELAPSFSGGGPYTIEVFDDGELVGRATEQQGITDVVIIWPIGGDVSVVASENPKENALAIAFVMEGNIAWRLPNGTTLTGDRIVMSDDIAALTSVETLQLRAANIPRIVITQTSVFNDCNGNGKADAEDIAEGTSLDANGNGVPDECEGEDISLNTGFDQATGTLLPVGAGDGDWSVNGGAARVVTNPPAAWGSPLAGSRWISVNANAASPGTTPIRFRRCFCLDDAAANVSLDLEVRADNVATVLLNGTALGTGGAFNGGAPLVVRRTGAAGDGLFRAGENCIDVDVADDGFSTGFTLAGSVSALGGVCPTP